MPNAKSEQFFRLHHREAIVLKLGQRKLFFNELELYTSLFLANALSFLQGKKEKEKPVIVIYAGAAAGIHSTLLAELFSSFSFHFYDMNPFFEKLKEYKNVHLYHQYFTDEDAFSFVSYAKKKKDKYIIFLSDVRTGEDEDAVERDMAMQKRWVEILEPDLCMLKFRLRWRPATKTEYFDGDIYFQPRIGFSSTETRLIFEPSFSPTSFSHTSFSHTSFSPNGEKENEKVYKKKIYDTEEYNNQLFYFQRHQRNAFHDFKLSSFIPLSSYNDEKIKDINIFPLLTLKEGIKGLCHCNDCWSEIKICIDFLKIQDADFFNFSSLSSYNDERNEKIKSDCIKIVEFMKKIEEHTKSTLDTPPHNLLVNERDINKRIKLLEKLSIKNTEKAGDKINEQKKERKVY